MVNLLQIKIRKVFQTFTTHMYLYTHQTSDNVHSPTSLFIKEIQTPMLLHFLLVTCDICSPKKTNLSYHNMPISKINLLLIFKVNCFILYYTTYNRYYIKSPQNTGVVSFRQSLIRNHAQREGQS
jgi:hypothetical protein